MYVSLSKVTLSSGVDSRMDDEPSLSTAIILWTGWGRATWPVCNESGIYQQFGADVADALSPRIRAIYEEFFQSDAKNTVAGLNEMGERAAAEFRSRHPEISDDAIEALAWCYTYENK